MRACTCNKIVSYFHFEIACTLISPWMDKCCGLLFRPRRACAAPAAERTQISLWAACVPDNIKTKVNFRIISLIFLTQSPAQCISNSFLAACQSLCICNIVNYFLHSCVIFTCDQQLIVIKTHPPLPVTEYRGWCVNIASDHMQIFF